MTTETYNGWKNYQTWNVSLWLNNEEYLYNAAVRYMRKYPNSPVPYARFIRSMGMHNDRTGDNIAWLGTRLDYAALNAMMRELIS